MARLLSFSRRPHSELDLKTVDAFNDVILVQNGEQFVDSLLGVAGPGLDVARQDSLGFTDGGDDALLISHSSFS